MCEKRITFGGHTKNDKSPTMTVNERKLCFLRNVFKPTGNFSKTHSDVVNEDKCRPVIVLFIYSFWLKEIHKT